MNYNTYCDDIDILQAAVMYFSPLVYKQVMKKILLYYCYLLNICMVAFAAPYSYSDLISLAGSGEKQQLEILASVLLDPSSLEEVLPISDRASSEKMSDILLELRGNNVASDVLIVPMLGNNYILYRYRDMLLSELPFHSKSSSIYKPLEDYILNEDKHKYRSELFDFLEQDWLYVKDGYYFDSRTGHRVMKESDKKINLNISSHTQVFEVLSSINTDESMDILLNYVTSSQYLHSADTKSWDVFVPNPNKYSNHFIDFYSAIFIGDIPFSDEIKLAIVHSLIEQPILGDPFVELFSAVKPLENDFNLSELLEQEPRLRELFLLARDYTPSAEQKETINRLLPAINQSEAL